MHHHTIDESATLISRIKNLETQIHQQQRELASLRTQRNEQSPVASVPLEVLSEIFHVAQALTPMETLPFAIKASHVSSRWRHAALISPFLWTNIILRPRAHEKFSYCGPWWRAPQILDLYLSRSSTCALDIDLELDQSWADYIQILAPHANRWRTFCLVANEGGPFDPSWQTMTALHAPLLERFTIKFPRTSGTTSYSNFFPDTPTLFTGGAPRLSHVEIPADILLVWSPPLHAITTFVLIATDDASLATDSYLRSALSSMRLIVNLTLSFDEVERERPTTPLPPITLPFLKSVCLIKKPHHSWLCVHTDTPHLEHVEIRGTQLEVEFGTPGSLPSVRTLLICDTTEDHTIREGTISAFPNIHHLIIDEGNGRTPEDLYEFHVLGFSFGPKKSAPATIPWPELMTFRIKRMACVNYEDTQILYNGLCARKKAGGNLPTIILPKNTSVERPDLYSALMEIAPVEESG